ncbi:MAG: glycosyltransferase family 9 protein [Chloroflexota bacterium]|nr:glycosyltransferase family 9 protein [Chloroflexota bacterium]
MSEPAGDTPAFLIVRLGALGDIVHTIPAAAALRAAYPAARIDWLVDARHREILDLVTCIDRVIVVESPTIAGWIRATRELRHGHYFATLDFQGLMKSAVLARASGAKKVLGFSIWHLREKGARSFYTESVEVAAGVDGERHVIHKNLRLLRGLGIIAPSIGFPLRRVPSAARDAIVAQAAGAPFAVINPGAAWPNKRWAAERFGELASFLREVRGLLAFVLWGPGEESLARSVVSASNGSAVLAPPTGLTDLVEICRSASLMVSGDTGPLHIAAAVGTPIVSIFGPTDPERNGPWRADDIAISRYSACGCKYDRECHQDGWCLGTLPVSEVTAGVQHRLTDLS